MGALSYRILAAARDVATAIGVVLVVVGIVAIAILLLSAAFA
jgi:hypothetical protein